MKMVQFLAIVPMFFLNTILLASAVRPGVYAPAPNTRQMCGSLTVTNIGQSFPGFSVAVDRSYWARDTETHEEVFIKDLSVWPFPNLGPVVPLTNWDKRTVSLEGSNCLKIVSEIGARDPSDAGSRESVKLCYNSARLTVWFNTNSGLRCDYTLQQ